MSSFNFVPYLKSILPQIIEAASAEDVEIVGISKITLKIPNLTSTDEKEEEIELTEKIRIVNTKNYIFLEIRFV